MPRGMLTREEVRELATYQSRTQSRTKNSVSYHLWEGKKDTLSEILNDDETQPNIRQITSTTEALALGLGAIQLTALVYFVIVASDRQFSDNDNLWISRESDGSDAVPFGIRRGSIKTENRSVDGGNSPDYTEMVLFKN